VFEEFTDDLFDRLRRVLPAGEHLQQAVLDIIHFDRDLFLGQPQLLKTCQEGMHLFRYFFAHYITVHGSIRNASFTITADSSKIKADGNMVLKSLADMPREKQENLAFGPRLAAFRKARGLTQIQLAEAAETTQRAISYYETDTGFPPAAALIALAKALHVTTDELLGIKPPKVERVDADSETRRLWKRFQQVTALPEKDQRAVIRLINSLVSGHEARGRARAS
jgi:transcriptional regulator with XRE-family HTH domain